jgi:hypothetical protein
MTIASVLWAAHPTSVNRSRKWSRNREMLLDFIDNRRIRVGQRVADKARSPNPQPDATRYCRHRCGRDRDVRGRARRSRLAAGQMFCHVYSRSVRSCRLAQGMPNSHGRDGIHRRLLDSVGPDPGSAWIRSLFGQCARHVQNVPGRRTDGTSTSFFSTVPRPMRVAIAVAPSRQP